MSEKNVGFEKFNGCRQALMDASCDSDMLLLYRVGDRVGDRVGCALKGDAAAIGTILMAVMAEDERIYHLLKETMIFYEENESFCRRVLSESAAGGGAENER
jgi:hypothetical protein